MRSLISATVAAIVALHSVLGCCWHHAHQSSVMADQIEQTTETRAERCGCHNSRFEKVRAADDDSRQHNSCNSCPRGCNDQCESFATPRLQHDEIALPQSSLLATIAQPIPPPIVFTSHARLADETVTPPPLRLHLLHQMLLI